MHKIEILWTNLVSSLIPLGRQSAPEKNPGEIYQTYFEGCLIALSLHGEIENYRVIPQFDPKDTIEGIDYEVVYHGQRIPLSVTSTWKEARKRRKKHPEIPVIFVRDPKKKARFLEPTDLMNYTIKVIKSYNPPS